MKVSNRKGRLVVRLSGNELRHLGFANGIDAARVRLSVEGKDRQRLVIRSDAEGYAVQPVANADPMVCCQLAKLGLETDKDVNAGAVETVMITGAVVGRLPRHLTEEAQQKTEDAKSDRVANCYNITGEIRFLKGHSMNNGGRFAVFRLDRTDNDPLPCIAFGNGAERILTGFKDHDKIRVFGYFEKHTFKTRSNEQKTVDRVRVLSAAAPRTA